MNTSDVTSFYRYEGQSYPSTVYIPPGPFQKFKALFQDPVFLGLGGAAIVLGTSALVVVNQRRISNTYKSLTRKLTRYYRRFVHGAPVLTTDHIKPIVLPQSTVTAEEVHSDVEEDAEAEAEAEAEAAEPASVEVVETVTPAVEEEKPAKVCTNDEKAACKNDCSTCPSSGDIEDIKRTTCKESGACDCAYPVKHAQNKPIRVDLTDDKNKYICRCGQSENFPYCDGAHSKLNAEQGTSISPLKVSRESTGKDAVYVCACGHAAGRPEKPFCDGSHSRVHVLQPEAAAEPEVVAEAEPEVAAEAEAAAEAEPEVEAEAEAVEAEEDSTVHVEAADAVESTVAIDESIVEAEEAFEKAEEAVAEAIEEAEEVIEKAAEEISAEEPAEEVLDEAVEAAAAAAEEVLESENAVEASEESADIDA